MSQLVRSLTLEEYEEAASAYCRALPPEHFMEGIPQAGQREITVESLALLRARRPDVRVYNELLVQYLHDGRLRQVCPDNMVVVGGDASLKSPGSYNVELEPAGPLWVLEYVSPRSDRKDYVDNYQKYEQELRVPYCLLFAPDRGDLRFYRLVDDRYQPIPVNDHGRLELPELDLEIALLNGWVRFWHQGELLDLPADLLRKMEQERERADQEKRRAEQEKRRADREKRRAEQEKRRADREKRRADQECERAEQEKQLRLTAEAELIRLRKLLRQANGDSGANGASPPE